MKLDRINRDVVLPLYFLGYALVTGALFVFLPRVVNAMPWDYSWAFLLVTPPATGLLLYQGVRSGRFSGLAVLAFVMGTVILGLGYLWFAFQFAAVV